MPVIKFFLLLALWQADSAPEGMAAFRRGDYRAAQQLLERSPVTPQTGLFLALTHAALGECSAANPELVRRFSDTSDPQLRRFAGLALAQCKMSVKDFASTGPVIAMLEREFPTDADVLYVSAAYHLKAWNDTIYRMYKNAPSSYRVDQLSAEVFETQNKYPEAVGEYRKAIRKNPKAIDLHYRLARALLAQSHDPAALEQARQEFAAELVLNPYDAVAEYQVGQILAVQSKPEDAAAHFERAVQLRPDFAEALIAVAKIRSGAKRYAEAVDLLERAVKSNPQAEAAHYNLMVAYRSAGRPADALREKAVIDKMQRPPEGEFANFLKRLGEPAPPK